MKEGPNAPLLKIYVFAVANDNVSKGVSDFKERANLMIKNQYWQYLHKVNDEIDVMRNQNDLLMKFFIWLFVATLK